MSIEAEIAAYLAKLYGAIEETMQTDVLDAAKSEIFSRLEGYEWAKSRGGAVGSGGLRDREQMLGTVERVGDQVVLEVTDEADFQNGEPVREGDTLSDVVTAGSEAYKMPYPRPFMEPAEQALGGGDFERALADGLRKRGF